MITFFLYTVSIRRGKKKSNDMNRTVENKNTQVFVRLREKDRETTVVKKEIGKEQKQKYVDMSAMGRNEAMSI